VEAVEEVEAVEAVEEVEEVNTVRVELVTPLEEERRRTKLQLLSINTSLIFSSVKQRGWNSESAQRDLMCPGSAAYKKKYIYIIASKN